MIPSAPQRLVGVADQYSRRLDALERRSRRNIVGILRRSLDGVLLTLRRSYQAYLGALGPVGYDPARNPIRRPGSYSTAEAATRFRAIVDSARGFLTDLEIQGWIVAYQSELTAASRLGGELGAKLAALSGQPASPFTGADPAVIRAAAQNVGALIQGEGVRFRDQLVQIVGEGATRGWGPKRLETQIRRALTGARDQRPGLQQRAATIARSELAKVYAEASLIRARERGDSYVRVLASNDERVCPTCASRNGRVYPTDRIVLPFHPRCRCVAVFVPNEAVEERNPAVGDVLLDSERWRAEHERGVMAYAEGKHRQELDGLRGQRERLRDPSLIEDADRKIARLEERGPDMKKAREDLARALRTPTAAEKKLFPTNPLPLAESVPLFR